MCIVAKTVIDGLQFVPGIGFFYFGVLCTVFVFARLRNLSASRTSQVEEADYNVLGFCGFLAVFCALEAINLWRVDGRNFEEVLKTATPFILLALWPRNSLGWTRTTIIRFAAVLILINALSAALPFAWLSWGGVKTLRGIYFFKTDLAYALVTGLLLLSIIYARQSFVIAIAAIAVGAMVVLTNSRLNYLTFAIVLAYIACCYARDVRRALISALAVSATAAICFYLYDEGSFLSPFDVSDTGRFTQGRGLIWEIAVTELLGNFGVFDWLFGRGVGHDDYLGYRYNPNAANNAHNEVLHLVLTRGVLGLLVYVLMWSVAYRFIFGRGLVEYRVEAVWGARVAFALFFLQGLTGNVSEFSTKTWPLIFALLLASTVRQDGRV
jgi:hypothetical protein